MKILEHYTGRGLLISSNPFHTSAHRDRFTFEENLQLLKGETIKVEDGSSFKVVEVEIDDDVPF